MKRNYVTGIIALATLTAAGTLANADTFSFASDSNSDGPIFAGPATTPPGIGAFTDGGALNLNQTVGVNFLFDADEDGPGAATSIPAIFTFSATFLSYTAIPVGGAFLHTYTANGFIQFSEAGSGASILRINYNNALFASWSDSATTLGETASLQDHEGVDPGISFIPGAALAGRLLNESEDFAFDLTNLRTADGGRVNVGPNGAPQNGWRSDGSFSAQAIPTPGTVALAGLAAGLLFRRRR